VGGRQGTLGTGAWVFTVQKGAVILTFRNIKIVQAFLDRD
jgi:hypothetical protein